MELELKAKSLQQIIKVIDSLDIGELSLLVGPDEVQCLGVDPHHIALANIRMPKTVLTFSEYKPSNKPHYFELNAIQDVLKLADPEDKIGLKASEKDYTGQVTLDSLTKDCNLSQYSSQPNIPPLTYSTKIDVPTKPFYRAVKAAEAVSEQITLFTNKDGFFMDADSSTPGEKVRFDGTKCNAVVKGNGANEKTTFDVGYLIRMAESVPDEFVILGLKSDHPLETHFKINAGIVKYLNAPAPKGPDEK